MFLPVLLARLRVTLQAMIRFREDGSITSGEKQHPRITIVPPISNMTTTVSLQP